MWVDKGRTNKTTLKISPLRFSVIQVNEYLEIISRKQLNLLLILDNVLLLIQDFSSLLLDWVAKCLQDSAAIPAATNVTISIYAKYL